MRKAEWTLLDRLASLKNLLRLLPRSPIKRTPQNADVLLTPDQLLERLSGRPAYECNVSPTAVVCEVRGN